MSSRSLFSAWGKVSLESQVCYRVDSFSLTSIGYNDLPAWRGVPDMPYSAEISRANPTCFLFLIDQSGSMADTVPNQPNRKKADAVADAINRLLQNLVIRCAKEEDVRDYFCEGEIG